MVKKLKNLIFFFNGSKIFFEFYRQQFAVFIRCISFLLHLNLFLKFWTKCYVKFNNQMYFYFFLNPLNLPIVLLKYCFFENIFYYFFVLVFVLHVLKVLFVIFDMLGLLNRRDLFDTYSKSICGKFGDFRIFFQNRLNYPWNCDLAHRHPIVVLIFEGNSEHNAHVYRKKCLFWTKNVKCVTPDFFNALNI